MPIIIAMLSPPIASRVSDALCALGLRKVGTPLLTASTPVSEVQPEAKARSSRMISATPVGSVGTKPKPADSATGACPVATLKNPAPSITNTLTRKP